MHTVNVHPKPATLTIDFFDRFFDRSFDVLFLIYVGLLIVLPGGDLLGVNVKILTFTVLSVLAAKRVSMRQDTSAIGTVIVVSVLFLWVFISIVHGFEARLALDQYRDIMVTIVNCWFGILFLVPGDREKRVSLLRAIVGAATITAVLKCLMLLYSLKTGIPTAVMVKQISDVFHVQLMAVNFDLMDTALGRIEFISDGILPICLFAIIARRREIRVSQFSALLISVVFLISIAVSFSRYRWAFAAFAMVVGFLVAKKEFFHGIFLAVATGGLIAGFDLISTLFTFRFSDAIAGSSDLERLDQQQALIDFCKAAPIFGHGLGSFTTAVIRYGELPYSYEMQLLALVGQIGIVGTLFLLGLLVAYFKGLLRGKKGTGTYRLALCAMLFVWLGGGFVNPVLMSSAASISYCALFALVDL
jgi:O-antigen ligase